MTDRVNGCWVAFDRDIRTDDVEAVTRAIRMLKCVAAVEVADCVTDPADWRAKQQVRSELNDVLRVAISTILEDRGPPYLGPNKDQVVAHLERVLAHARKAT